MPFFLTLILPSLRKITAFMFHQNTTAKLMISPSPTYFNMQDRKNKFNKKAAEKKPLHRKITFITAMQSLYLTEVFYFSNDLFSYASACAFGFLFSFVPVVMMILVILLRILHASPEMITSILNTSKVFSNTFDIQYLIDSVVSIKTITNFEIILGLAIIWMARRFFSSVMAGMHTIF